MTDECEHSSWDCNAAAKPTRPVHKCTDCTFCWYPDTVPNPDGLFCVNCLRNQYDFSGSESEEDSVQNSSNSFGYVTKDSGKREEFDSGMVRDTEEGKPRFDLLIPRDVPYSDQFFTRVAGLLARGAEKYSDRNWEKASGDEELARFQSSGFRHFMQWLNGESDEDHAAAVVFNLLAYETILYKLKAQDD